MRLHGYQRLISDRRGSMPLSRQLCLDLCQVSLEFKVPSGQWFLALSQYMYAEERSTHAWA
jgi:hypothetical protein